MGNPIIGTGRDLMMQMNCSPKGHLMPGERFLDIRQPQLPGRTRTIPPDPLSAAPAPAPTFPYYPGSPCGGSPCLPLYLLGRALSLWLPTPPSLTHFDSSLWSQLHTTRWTDVAALGPCPVSRAFLCSSVVPRAAYTEDTCHSPLLIHIVSPR